ncbi:MAG: hypothetical protein II247_02675 [Lachnospiraceae bacterium]|nr:hypothetical protein [Lachnospiraceae bacterium]
MAVILSATPAIDSYAIEDAVYNGETSTEETLTEEILSEETLTEEASGDESSTEEKISEEDTTDTSFETETEEEFIHESDLEIETGDETESETESDSSAETTKESGKQIVDGIKEKLEIQYGSDAEENSVDAIIDPGFDADLLQESAAPGNLYFAEIYANDEIPVAYSSVKSNNYIPCVKDQGNWGTCWAFSAVSAAESAYMRLFGKEANLSETQLVNFFYNDNVAGPDGGLEGDAINALNTGSDSAASKVNRGGNSAFTTFAMARWTGIADESLDASLVYPLEQTYSTTELNISSEFAYKDALHMQNAYWINKNDSNEIKKSIMQYGLVCMNYKDKKYFGSDDYSKSDVAYDGPCVYYNNDNGGTGHAVAIVGWDDNFDRSYFENTVINQELKLYDAVELPKNNGAWLVKNSWGTDAGDEGYFWISYEDVSIFDTLYVFEFEKADNYAHIYQYDGSAGTKYYYDNGTVEAAAIYTAKGNELIEAVGVGVASVNTDYTVEIYTNITDISNPQSGNLVSTTSGTTTFQGYYTVKLDETVLVSKDTVFSVVVRLSGGRKDNEDKTAIFIDKTYDNGSVIQFIAKVNQNETFIKNNGSWIDGADSSYDCTFRIKAYTSNYDHDIPQENIALTLQMVQEIEDQEYSGDKNAPELVISYMGERLVRDVDYSVNYVNNDQVADRTGENAPKAIITGMGKYNGTVEQTFTILPKTITEEMVETTSLMYDGSVQDDLKVIDDTVQLVKGTDYTISFSKQPCNAGTYQAEVTGKGNYTGTLQLSVTIGKTTLNDEMIIVPATVEYAGKAIKPQVKVCVNGKELPAASFSVSYKNNTNAGTAVVTVTGKGGCQGKVEKNFTILPRDISENLSVVVAKATYTGKDLTPSVTVKCDGRSLRKGTDYTVTYENNRAAGESAAVTITGKGNYTGVFGQAFTILPKELSAGSVGAEIGYGESGSMVRVLNGKTELSETDCSAVVYRAGTSTAVDMSQLVLGEKYDVEITLKGNYTIKNAASVRKTNIVCRKSVADLTVGLENASETFIYNGKAQKPKLIVREQSGTEVPKSNYTISYVDNINAGTATAVVTGKGAYAGTKKLEFTIQRQQLDNLTIQQVKDQTYAQKVICPAIKVMDGKKTLKSGAGKDYVCTYANNVDVSYDNGNVIAGAYAEIQLSDNYAVPEGTNLRVYFKILPAKITSLTLSKAHYTGEAVLPDNIVVKAGKLVVPLESYEVTANNNVNVSGSAVLTVTAKAQSNYTGSLSKKYSIVKQELKKCILPAIPDMPYLGQPVDVSGFALKQQNGEEIGSDQYTITVKNNTKPGKATVTYVAKSDSLYRGSVSIRFNIVKGTVAQAIDKEAAKAIEKPYTGEEITLTEEEIRQLAPIKAYTGSGNPPYTVTYAKNTNAGKAFVKLTGKDYLQGSATVYFTITPKSVSSLKITTGEKRLSYNGGTPVYLELNEVTDGDQVLKAGKDYTYSYTNADKKGTACLTVTGVGNYTGTRYIYYKIN